MNNIFAVFSVLYFAHLAAQTVLSLKNIRYAHKMAGKIPEFYKGKVEAAQYEASLRYSIENDTFGVCTDIFISLAVYFALVMGVFNRLDLFLQGVVGNLYARGVCFILLIEIALVLLSLPLKYYSSFHIEGKYGFNRISVKGFFFHAVKSAAVSIAIGIPVILGVLFVMESSGKLWWVYLLALLTIYDLGLNYIHPVLIQPIFADKLPIKDEVLKGKIERLAIKLSFPVGGIYFEETSKVSSHANAAFMGFGASRSIIITDTMIDSFTHEEIVAIICHEIGHYKKKHGVKIFVFAFALLALDLFVLSLLADKPEFYSGFFFDNQAKYITLFLYYQFSDVISFVFAPLSPFLSRQHEYEADRYVKNFGHSKDLITALQKLDAENLANLTPHPWYYFVYYTHPTTEERICQLTV